MKVLGTHLHIIYMFKLSNTDTFKRLEVQHESRAITVNSENDFKYSVK